MCCKDGAAINSPYNRQVSTKIHNVSVSGGGIMYEGVAVSWFSRTQRTSHNRAEYVGISESVQEVGVYGVVLPDRCIPHA